MIQESGRRTNWGVGKNSCTFFQMNNCVFSWHKINLCQYSVTFPNGILYLKISCKLFHCACAIENLILNLNDSYKF